MPSLIENIRSRTGGKMLKGRLIHMDNARPHNSGPAQRCLEISRAERLPHPACSPDLIPSDFFLSGYIKEKSSDCDCESQEDLLNAITEIFTGVDQEVLLCVFESWVNGLKWVIKHEGEGIVHLAKKKRETFLQDWQKKLEDTNL
jgi:hydrogenase maturation factor